MRSVLRIVVVLLGAALASGSAHGQGKTDPQLQKVFDNWKKRQDRLKTARYTLSGTVEHKQFPEGITKPTGSPVRPIRFVLLLDIERKRFRLETTEDHIVEGLGYATRVKTISYDGKALNTLTHREANGFPTDSADLSLQKGYLYYKQIDSVLAPVFFAHGIVPTAGTLLIPNQLPTTPDPESFSYHGNQTHNSRSCAIVRTEALPAKDPVFDEIWVDNDRDGAVARHVAFAGTNPWNRLDVEWKSGDSGWWPDRWSHTWTSQGQVRRVTKLRVESFEPDCPVVDADFTFPVKPGMKVVVVEYPEPGSGLDPTRPSEREYKVSDSGRWEELSAKGFTTNEGVELPPEARHAWVWWAAGIGSCLLLMIGTYWIWFRRRNVV